MVAIKSCPDCKTWVVVYGMCKKGVSICVYTVYKRFGTQELSVKYSSWCQMKQMKPCYLSCGHEGGTRDHREEALCYGVHSRGCNYTYCWVLLMKSCISVIIKERFPISWATPSKILNEGMWQLSYPFICLWTSRLLPCPGYYKQCCNGHWGTRVSLNAGFLAV